MCEPTTIGLALGYAGSTATAVGVAAYGALATTALTAYQGQQARIGQTRAADMAGRDASLTAQRAEEATNRANAKSPDVAAALSAALLSGKMGNSSTMLTGPQGVDPSKLLLGKSTLLGG